MTCETCIKIKDKPTTYTKCKTCGDWRKMNEGELKLAKKAYRFGENGTASRDY